MSDAAFFGVSYSRDNGNHFRLQNGVLHVSSDRKLNLSSSTINITQVKGLTKAKVTERRKSGSAKTFSFETKSNVRKLNIFSGGQVSKVNNRTSISSKIRVAGKGQILGGNGRDTIYGSKKRDIIKGRGGNDLILGSGGNDYIEGGNGSDVIRGGSGADAISGGTGNDSLRGDRGNDQLYGNAGKDKLRGGAGNDTIDGGASRDLLYGDQGDDILF